MKVFKNCNAHFDDTGKVVKLETNQGSYFDEGSKEPDECSTADDCYKKFGNPPPNWSWECQEGRCVLVVD